MLSRYAFRSAAAVASSAAVRLGAARALSTVRTIIVSEPNPLSKLAEEEAYIAEAVKTYAENEIKPKISQMDSAGALDADVLSGLFAQGFMGITVDAEYGGTQSSFAATCLVVEELSRQDAAVGAVAEMHNVLCNMTVAAHGDAEQRAEYLPRLAGDTLAAVVKTDANVPGATPLTARHDAGGAQYVVQGKQAWCTQARAGLLLVWAGDNVLLVDADQAGVRMGQSLDKLGLRAAQVALVDFDDVTVPESRVLGRPGAAQAMWLEAQTRSQISGSALLVGLARGVYDATMPYLYQRTQFGTAIANFQGMQHQRAQVATEIEAARLLTYNAARLLDHGHDHHQSARMAFNYATRVARKATSKSIEWLGGVGYTKDFTAEKFYRDCKMGARFPLLTSQ